MRILIYGAGVIGTLYGVLFSKAGFDTSIYARGKRLEALQKKGVLFCNLKSKIEKISDLKVIAELEDNDEFDFIFLCVRENQLHIALAELKKNCSPHIVTMVNSLEKYCIWEEICGKNRIIPAFPGAGGSIKEDVLYARLTPYIIQPTTFSEIQRSASDSNRDNSKHDGSSRDNSSCGNLNHDNSRDTPKNKLISIFKKAGIPYQTVEDMHIWQICHLAMVVPLADAYYASKNKLEYISSKESMINKTSILTDNSIEKEAACIDKNVWKQKEIMKNTAMELKRNFKILKKKGYKISPKKLNLFLWIPTWLLAICLRLLYRSKFADTFMYQHSLNAKEEMFELHNNFYRFLEQNKV